MARQPNRSQLGERLRATLEGDTQARGKYEEQFFDDGGLAELGVATEAEQEAARDRGEVFGAGTGRAERAIQAGDLEDIRWDPTRPYPQIQTTSTDPERPRTIAAGYDPKNAILRVTFRNGSVYEYLGVPPRVWSNFQRVVSPGKAINRVLNQYPYRPMEE